MIIEVIILLLGVPVGFLLAYWGNDELVQGRKWFKKIIFLAVVLGGYFAFDGRNELVWMMGFMLVVTSISYWESFDKRWVRKVFK